VVAGPVIAVLSFVCSVGNIPLAAVLWSGGISFAGVMAFIFADLIVLPIIAIYRKYYGWAFALRITALMFLTMIVAGLAIAGIFSGAGLIPETRPTPSDVFGSIELDYRLALNLLAVIVFAGLFWLTMRRGITDPVCGMKIDREKGTTAGGTAAADQHDDGAASPNCGLRLRRSTPATGGQDRRHLLLRDVLAGRRVDPDGRRVDRVPASDSAL
jgi:uncharacterized membrane protein YraQ (UPF0718 family)